MTNKAIRTLVLAALFAALTCVATMVIQIPSPMNGFVNLGDCFVLLAGWVLGPLYGSLAAGIGSALADMFTGYMHYAPGTFLIKAVMALISLCQPSDWERPRRAGRCGKHPGQPGAGRCRRCRGRAALPHHRPLSPAPQVWCERTVKI